MILSAHQPAYLPWLGMFHKMAVSDIFCVVDTVPYSRYDFINRNRIKTAAGPLWLTVPVRRGGWATGRICDLRTSQNDWQRKHVASIAQSYRRAPYFHEYAGELGAVIAKRHTFLSELTGDLLRLITRWLGIDTPLVMASDYEFSGKKSEYVVDMCRKLGATALLFGSHGRVYADSAAFAASGIEIFFQEYRHPVYRQLYGDFVPRMSIVDLLFNEGPRSLEILLSGNERYANTAK
jgi:hypothetical protein